MGASARFLVLLDRDRAPHVAVPAAPRRPSTPPRPPTRRRSRSPPPTASSSPAPLRTADARRGSCSRTCSLRTRPRGTRSRAAGRRRVPRPDLRFPRVLPGRRRRVFGGPEADRTRRRRDLRLRSTGCAKRACNGSASPARRWAAPPRCSSRRRPAASRPSSRCRLPRSIEGLAAGPDVLTQIAGAKLYIAGLGDPSGAATSADTLAAQSPQPVREEIVTSDAHGTDLLTSHQGEHVQS